MITNIKNSIPGKLAKFNLNINETKTEEYIAPDLPETDSKHSWKKCKLLGSCLDTKEDINRRKALVICTMKKYRKTYQSKYLSIEQKVRHFNMYIQSIMLYNCELWTMTETLNKGIDSFQRRQLRYVINVIWPKIITNDKLYELTNVTPWREIVEKRRMSWLGHLMRLDPETPARVALSEALIPTPRKRGRPPATWISTIQRDLQNRNIDIRLGSAGALSELALLADDRKHWRTVSKLPASGSSRCQP